MHAIRKPSLYFHAIAFIFAGIHLHLALGDNHAAELAAIASTLQRHGAGQRGGIAANVYADAAAKAHLAKPHMV